MALDSTIRIDKAKEIHGVTKRVCRLNGVWQVWEENAPIADIVPKENTGTVTVGRLNNPKYTDYIQEQVVALGGARNQKDTEQTNRIIERGLAKHVLLNWGEFEEDGAPLEFSETNAIKKLREDNTFKSFILELADTQSLFFEDVVEEQIKN